MAQRTDTSRATPPDRRDFAVALSGGGVRASVFGLGALIYLVDSGLNRAVTTVSSVSGGSITNAFVAQRVDFSSCDKGEFDRTAKELLGLLASKPLFGKRTIRWTAALLAALAASSLSITVASWPIRLPIPARFALLLLVGVAFSMRGWIVELRLRRNYFRNGRRTTRLAEIGWKSTTHVICATDVHAGRPAFFLPWRGGFLNTGSGWSRDDRLKLATAVRASTALPGAFPPRLVGRRPLVDGGVWDNLATQWFDRGVGAAFNAYEDRTEHSPMDALPGTGSGDNPTFSSLVLAVNASGGLKPVRGRRWVFRVPFVGEMFSTVRVMSVLYENTIEPREQAAALTLESKIRRPHEVSLEDSFTRSVATLGDLDAAKFEVLPQLRRAAPSLKYDYLRHRYEMIANQVEQLSRDASAYTDTQSIRLSIGTSLDRLDVATTRALLIDGYLQAAVRSAPLAALSSLALEDLTIGWPGVSRFDTFFD